MHIFGAATAATHALQSTVDRHSKIDGTEIPAHSIVSTVQNFVSNRSLLLTLQGQKYKF